MTLQQTFVGGHDDTQAKFAVWNPNSTLFAYGSWRQGDGIPRQTVLGAEANVLHLSDSVFLAIGFTVQEMDGRT